MRDYFQRVVARAAGRSRRRSRERSSSTGERGERLGEAELIASCVLLLFAGHETTTNLIGNGVARAARWLAPLGCRGIRLLPVAPG